MWSSLSSAARRAARARGARIDERRYAHFDQADRVFAYEFLFVSDGVDLEGIDPRDAALIREAIDSIGQLAVA